MALITPIGAAPQRGETGPCSLTYKRAYAVCRSWLADPHCEQVVLSLTAPAFEPRAARTSVAAITANRPATASAAALCVAIRPPTVHGPASWAGGVVEALVLTAGTDSSHDDGASLPFLYALIPIASLPEPDPDL
jgi:hypothetical protein